MTLKLNEKSRVKEFPSKKNIILFGTTKKERVSYKINRIE